MVYPETSAVPPAHTYYTVLPHNALLRTFTQKGGVSPRGVNSALLLSRAVGRVTIYVDIEGRLFKTNRQTKRRFSDSLTDHKVLMKQWDISVKTTSQPNNSFPSSNQVGRGCEKCLICLLSFAWDNYGGSRIV